MGEACPTFEGSEKRLELHFRPLPKRTDTSTVATTCTLRSINREELDALMSMAACEIISCTSSSTMDAYVLSESSLFVTDTTWVLKTCGTTQPLSCVTKLLSITEELGLQMVYVRYSRASFLHPHLQPSMHQSFRAEIETLQPHTFQLGNGGSAFQLGDCLYGLQWYIFVAADEDLSGSAQHADELQLSQGFPSKHTLEQKLPIKTMEICMTNLCQDMAQKFVRTKDFKSSSKTTQETGISELLPGAAVDDVVFEPCGYSMNGVEESQFITIHVTPEEECSYASCEVHNFASYPVYPQEVLSKTAKIFAPERFVVAFTTNSAACLGYSSPCLSAAPDIIPIPGYGCVSATIQEMSVGGSVVFFSYARASNDSGSSLSSALDDKKSVAAARPPAVLRSMSCLSSRMSSTILHVDSECSDNSLQDQVSD